MRASRFVLPAGAWLLLAAAVAATLVPLGDRPATGFGPLLERMLAFAAVGGAFILAYPRHRLAVSALLTLAVAALEWAQRLGIDRHGRPEDAAEKLIGLFLGIAAALVLSVLIPRLSRR